MPKQASDASKTTPTLQEMIDQRAALDLQIDELRTAARADSLSECRTLIEQFGLLPAEVFPPRTKAGTLRKYATPKTVAPKYRDPETGATWSGRGKAPKWIAGLEDRSQYAI